MPKITKTAKFAQNPPKMTKIVKMGKKIQILLKGLIYLQNTLKNYPKFGKCPKLPKIAQFTTNGQKRQNLPKMPKITKTANVQNSPKMTKMVKKFQILPKGQIYLQNTLKI